MIDDTASIEMAVSSIILSKTFDNGVICASEQSVVVMDKVYDAVRKEFQRRGAYFLNEEEKVGERGPGLGAFRLGWAGLGWAPVESCLADTSTHSSCLLVPGLQATPGITFCFVQVVGGRGRSTTTSTAT